MQLSFCWKLNAPDCSAEVQGQRERSEALATYTGSVSEYKHQTYFWVTAHLIELPNHLCATDTSSSSGFEKAEERPNTEGPRKVVIPLTRG